MHRSDHRSPLASRRVRPLAAVLAAGVALVALAGPAAAHTEATAAPAADGRTALTFSFNHGCDGLPTTALRIQLPEGATDVRPLPVDGWTATTEDRVVTWRGGSIPDHQQAAFTVEAVLAEPAGTEVPLPSIQECPDGAEEAWIQLADGSGADGDHPAPVVVVPVNDTTPTTAAAAPTTEAGGPTTTARMTIEDTPITLEGSDRNNAGLVIGGIAVGVIVVGAVVLYLRHRPRRA